MNRADKKEYRKAYREAHRDEIKAYREAHRDEIKAYREAHRAEKKEYNKAYREAHKAEAKAYREAHRDEIKAYLKAYHEAHRDEIREYSKAYREAHRDEIKAYRASDTNSNGLTKKSIRSMSSYYLFKVLRHTKVEGYEIHHCFGYEDYKKFIYIPRELHLQIHQFLRDNGIDADSDHYSKIEHLIVNYLKCNERHVLIMNGEEDE